MASTIWKGHLSFGLVSIPVKLYRAARAEKVSFRQLHRSPAPAQTAPPAVEARPLAMMPDRIRPAAFRTQPPRPAPPEPAEPDEPVEQVSRVRQRIVTEDGEAPVERSQLVKGYEYEKDRFVVVEADELRAIAPETAREMQITEFVRLSEIDPVYFESSYYVAPETAGERAYALLYEALRESGYVAIAGFAMHRREHVVALRPGPRGILLHTLFYNSEIRTEDEFRVDRKNVVAKELEVAKMLIDSMAASFDPTKFRDEYRQRLEALIQAKIEGRAIAEPAAPKPAAIVNILEALQSSLALTRKPVAAAESPSAPRKRKRSG